MTRDEAAGYQGLEAACRFISAHDGQAHGRVRGVLYPLQVDTCARELLQATRQAADSPCTCPCRSTRGKNLMELHQTLRKYRRTPVELLDEGLDSWGQGRRLAIVLWSVATRRRTTQMGMISRAYRRHVCQCGPLSRVAGAAWHVPASSL